MNNFSCGGFADEDMKEWDKKVKKEKKEDKRSTFPSPMVGKYPRLMGNV